MKKKKKMDQSKERLKTITIGSTLQKIGKNGLDLKKIHYELCKMTEKENIKTRTLNKAAAAQRSRAL